MAIPSHRTLLDQYRAVRSRTESLAAPLSPEDQTLQSMPDCSPTRWHRAHTTWFFEKFVLGPRGVGSYQDAWAMLFNSYYEAAGPRHPRARRGVLSRPSVAEIGEYRRVVDARMAALLERASDAELAALSPLVALGLAHEEQHQELLLTDILHAFHESPLRPVYRTARGRTDPPEPPRTASCEPARFRHHEGGLVEVGAAPTRESFAFDNESPRHRVWLEPYALADRLVTVGEMKAFVTDRGYETPSLWLAEGLDWVRANGITAPGYARIEGGACVAFGLDGERECSDDEPATHLSFYEADAVGRYLGARLPTEFEWEHAAAGAAPSGHFLDDDLRPLPPSARPSDGATPGLFGDAWTWTRSGYEPYPGYAPGAGALGEYNGKFMVGQCVLRGGSYLTPPGHVRGSYRNFWPPATRFQVTGVRLAR